MSASRLTTRRRVARSVAAATALAVAGLGLTAGPALAEVPAPEPEITETAAADEIPADEVPTEEATAEEAPTAEVPAEEAPTAEVPAEEAPADETPTEEAPADVEPGTDEAAAPTEISPLVVTDGDTFLSEIHYDNASTDVGEAIEVQAPAGTDLTGWTLVLYNGSNDPAAAVTYGSAVALDVVGDSGVVVVDYPANGIQNGGNDGVALVDADGDVVELLSYEGELTASGGPADGLTSTDIGVAEAGSESAGQSLQRLDGTWTGPVAASFGVLNTAPDDEEPEAPEPGEVVPIAEIQGTGDASGLDGTTVTTTGVVTATYPTGGFDGYYIQTAGTGGDTAPEARTASDAVFVYSSATVDDVAVGDHVQVTGEVDEFNGLTEITVLAGGASVLDDPAEPVEPITDFELPASETDREVVEGMLVLPTDDYVVSDTYALGGFGTSAFGSIGLGLGGPLVQETDVALPGTAGFDVVAADNAARAVTLDDGQSNRTATTDQVPYLTDNPDLRTGVGLSFEAPVVVDYRFQWNFQPTAPVTGATDLVTVAGGNTQAANATPEDVGGDLQLASFNVLNYFTALGEDIAGCTSYDDRAGNPLTVAGGCDARGAWDEENLERQTDKIVAAINGLDADVVGLAEIENSAVFGPDRDAALATLVEALNADAGAGTWEFAPSPAQVPADEDVIRTAFIYQPDTVALDGDSVILTGSEAFTNAREPLAQAFTSVENPGYGFLAITNHFKSKGGECGDLPEGCFDADRTAQALALTEFAAGAAEDAGTEDVFLVGDFNSYTAENPLLALEEAGYTNLNPGEPSYVFDGKVGSLDHVFASSSAAERVTGADVWRINADESVLAEYSRFNYFASSHVQEGTPFRASDHNPMIVGIAVPEAAPTPGEVLIDVLSINDFHGRIEANDDVAGAAVLSCAVDEFRAENENTLFVSAGDNIGASTFVSAVADDQPTLDVLNEMDLDVSTLGNHEFDGGRADVDDRVAPASEFPYVAANIYDRDSGERAYDPYWLSEQDGVTVGFIGAMTEDLPRLVSPSGIESLEVRDMTAEVNDVADDLTDGEAGNGEADVLVVLVHDGAPRSSVGSAAGTSFGDLVADVDEGVAAIISAHTHQTYVEESDGTWVTQTGSYGEMLGHLQLAVDTETGDVTATAENVDLVDEPTEDVFEPICEGDPAVQAIVDAAVEEAEVLGSVPVGEISADMLRAVNSDGSENRSGESTVGNFIADVQLWATQDVDSQIAFMNPGGIRDDLLYEAADDEGDGVVTYEEAAIVQPFANTLVVVELTGDQVVELLEQQWAATEGGGEELSKLGASAGFAYTYDPSAPRGERILEATLDGEPLGSDETYRVTVNSFMASGGDGYTALTEGEQADTGRVDLDAMVDFFEAQTEPAEPPYDQRSIGATWVSDPDATYAVGDDVELDLSSLTFSRDEPKPTEVSVTIGGEDAGSYAVDPTIVDVTDEVGRAEVRATVPEGVSGEVELVVTDEVSGTTFATSITVGEDDGGPGPGGSDDPTPVPDDDLTDDSRADVTIPSVIVRGQLVTAFIGAPGDEVNLWLQSDPFLIGTFTVGQDGTVTFLLPVDAPLGEHRFVVTDLDDELVGWAPTRVVDPATDGIGGGGDTGGSGYLPSTGSDVLGVLAIALLLMGTGVAAIWVRRRSTEN